MCNTWDTDFFNLTDVCRQQSKESDMLASANKMSITENTYRGEED